MDTSTPALRALSDISSHWNISKNNTPCPLNGAKNYGSDRSSPPAAAFLKPPEFKRKRSSLSVVTLAQVNPDGLQVPSQTQSTQQAKRKRSPLALVTPAQVDSGNIPLPSLESTQQSTAPKVRNKKISRGVAIPKTQKKTLKPRRAPTTRQNRQGAVFTVDKIHEDPVSRSEMQRQLRASVDSFIDDECDETTPRRARKMQKVTGVHWRVEVEAKMNIRDVELQDADADLMGWKKMSVEVTTKTRSKTKSDRQAKAKVVGK